MIYNSIASAFGVALKECRQKVGLTQEKLALDAGIDRSYVSELENGLKEPGVGIIFKVSSVLKMTQGAIVERAYSLVGPPAARESSPPSAAAIFALGEEACPRCNAIYSVHVRVLRSEDEGSFSCVSCGREINRWFGTRAMVYSLLQPQNSDANTGQ